MKNDAENAADDERDGRGDSVDEEAHDHTPDQPRHTRVPAEEGEGRSVRKQRSDSSFANFGSKLYRKFGAEASSSARQARLVAAYEKRKKMDVTGAIALSEPINSTN